MRPEIGTTQEAMERHGYIADAPTATSVYLSRTMRKPPTSGDPSNTSRPIFALRFLG